MDKGLYFKKIDLHVHTPASSCFSNKEITPIDIVKSAVSKELDAIAITDHNTGEWIDRVKQAARGKDLIVFPGVEITASEGFHILGIFDKDKSSEDINNFLGYLNINSSEYAKSDTICKFGCHEIIEKIIERGGLAILAHIDNKKGAYYELKGNNRIKLFDKADYSAVEISSEELPELLNNKDVFKRTIAYYQASDNPDPKNLKKHSIEGIGNKFSYFKMGEINLEGLRQCFSDPDVRIKNMNSLIENRYPQIKNIKASDGFLKYQNIIFHPGLNSIIGGKGVGKSLIIELLRFGLGQPSRNIEILKDYDGKLDKRLGKGNYVEIDIMLQSGATYRVTHVLDGEHTCVDLGSGEKYEGDISELFPILAYSQTEVIKIAENEGAQLELIDSFINRKHHIQNIKEQVDRIKDNDNILSQSINAKFEITSVYKELNTLKTQIAEIDKSLKNDIEEEKILDEYKALDEKSKIINNKLDNIDELNKMVDSLYSKLPILDNLDSEIYNEDEHLNIIDSKYKELRENIIKDLNNISKYIVETKESIFQEISSFTEEFARKKEEYDLIFSKTEEKNKLRKKRDSLSKRCVEKDNEHSLLSKQANNFVELKSERDELLNQLDKLYNDYYNSRLEMYNQLTEKSEGKLKLELQHSKNTDSFYDTLRGLLKGSNTQSKIIESICKNITPRNFVDIIIRKDQEELGKVGDIDKNNAEKIMSKLLSGESLEPVLSLQYDCYPEDVPSIQFKKPNGEYSPLKELSVGQKCTALLIIALSEGGRPVIIDQPEDALDITTVWEDVSTSLRGNKERRQFILTTHNSSVAVASDSDNFIIVNSNSSIANVKCKGSIDDKEVKKDVIRCLEGGEIPYLLRGSKYNIN